MPFLFLYFLKNSYGTSCNTILIISSTSEKIKNTDFRYATHYKCWYQLKNLVQQSLEGKSQHEIKDDLKADYESFVADKLQRSINEIYDRYRTLIKNIPSEKKIIKIIKEDPDLAQQAIQLRTEELTKAREKRIADEDKVTSNKKQYINGLFYYFRVGKKLQYPVPSFDGTARNQLAVFLGFQIDPKKNNPYAPSAIKLKFAIASSQKYLAIPASYVKDIQAIKGASIGIGDVDLETILTEWASTISENTKDRQIRYIVSGNILQAFSAFKGKLVSYTTNKRETKKGILMSEFWSVDTETKGRVIVPIAKAFKIVRSITNGSALYASHNLAFFKLHDNTFRIAVPASMKKGAAIYLNKDILKLVTGNNFEKVGDQMTTHLEQDNLEKFLEILQENIGVTVSLTQTQIDSVGLTVTKTRKRVKIIPPPKEKAFKMDTKLLELEAEALELELELLSF